jgi:hypothetical protein
MRKGVIVSLILIAGLVIVSAVYAHSPEVVLKKMPFTV